MTGRRYVDVALYGRRYQVEFRNGEPICAKLYSAHRLIRKLDAKGKWRCAMASSDGNTPRPELVVWRIGGPRKAVLRPHAPNKMFHVLERARQLYASGTVDSVVTVPGRISPARARYAMTYESLVGVSEAELQEVDKMGGFT